MKQLLGGNSISTYLSNFLEGKRTRKRCTGFLCFWFRMYCSRQPPSSRIQPSNILHEEIIIMYKLKIEMSLKVRIES
uniref:Uncharacterized protein n=1 Tax=Aegilops tauschii subsp. strangulata TaxID=200361 RepID=A0A453JRS8_AEGTS